MSRSNAFVAASSFLLPSPNRRTLAFVFVGAFLALAVVSGLAAALGRTLLTRMKLSTLRRIGGGVCLLLAAYTAVEIAGVL